MCGGRLEGCLQSGWVWVLKAWPLICSCCQNPPWVGLAPSPKFLLQELLALVFPTVSPLSISAVVQVHQPPGPSALGGLPALGVWHVVREDSLGVQGGALVPGQVAWKVSQAQRHLGVDPEAPPPPSPFALPPVPGNNCLRWDKFISG